MVTRNKPLQNKPLPASVRPSEEERKVFARTEPEVDLFIVHDERIKDAPAGNIPSDVSKEPPRETEYTLQKILFENKVAELASRIAHELNNPIATVLVYVQLLLAKGNLDQSSKEGLETMYKEAQRANAITADLLSFARRGKPEKSLISIQEVIQKSLELYITRLRANNIELVVKLQPDIPSIMADPHQMQKAFANIITNAEQAMTEAQGKGKLYIKAQVAGELIRITFEDNGPGIKPNNLKSIFDPFFTTREMGLGLGLGLSICCAILESHGGCIYAMNKPGQGATFVVELPIVA
jgi:C4-dicarboxylate-specific signal transduction histidine kinase